MPNDPRPNRRQRRVRATPGWTFGKRCFCDTCRGRTSWPAYYVVPVWIRRPGRPARRSQVSYECFIEADPHLLACDHGETSSASAAGLRWLADMKAGGVRVKLNELALSTEDGSHLAAEAVWVASLLDYLEAMNVPAGDWPSRERRFLDLRRMFGDRPMRLGQWLAREYPGWRWPGRVSAA